MGQFSWLDCDRENERHRAIMSDVLADVYVLIPKEFGGGHILETEYDGYGNFGGHDIYDLVADWNKNYVDETYICNPMKEQCEVNRLKDFKDNIDDKTMIERYGKNWKREIGISIACYDEQNAKLKYPIKITHNSNLTYEDAKYFSLSDVNQGWGSYEDIYDDDGEWVEEIAYDPYDDALLTYREIEEGRD